jgi:hypothetical protein
VMIDARARNTLDVCRIPPRKPGYTQDGALRACHKRKPLRTTVACHLASVPAAFARVTVV